MEIIAHRGASHDAPENTVAAARLAWKQNADAIEFDVRLTRDGRLASFHDANTHRLTGVHRWVRASTIAKLQQLRIRGGARFGETGTTIPTLEEMLATVPRGKRAFVELKAGPVAVPELTRAVKQSGLKRKQIVVIAFDLSTVRAAKRSMPGCECCWILDYDMNLSDTLRRARAAGIDGIDISSRVSIDRTFVSQVHRAGFSLYVWTVDNPALARQLASAGIDGVATNRPAWLRARL